MVNLFNSKKNNKESSQMDPEEVFKLHNEKAKKISYKKNDESEEVKSDKLKNGFEVVESSEYELGEKIPEKKKVKKEKRKKVNVEQYKDLEGITIKKLTLGLWLVEHRRLISTLFYGFIAGIAVLSWGYFILSLGGYLIFGMREDQKIIGEIVSGGEVNHGVVLQQAPKNLRFGNVKIINLDDNRYDFLVEVSNVNKQHWASFDYHFISNGEDIGHAEGFILPSESKYIYLLGEKLGRRPSGVEVRIENLSWNRIDKAEYPNWDSFYEDHLRLKITDKEFIPESLSELSEKLDLNILRFNITNDTAYSYWEVELSIRLMSRNTIIGAEKLIVDNLMSGETREVEITWPGKLSKVGDIVIYPEVNIVDESVYIKPQGEPTSY
jgi:hypothetical protein